jgi:hypothetical protein
MNEHFDNEAQPNENDKLIIPAKLEGNMSAQSSVQKAAVQMQGVQKMLNCEKFSNHQGHGDRWDVTKQALFPRLCFIFANPRRVSAILRKKPATFYKSKMLAIAGD